MSIWDICIRRPVFTTMLVLGPVVLGLASYARLGVELFPNVDVPVVVVTTTLSGASVEEMESAVTKPVEEAVNTVSGIDELRSHHARRASRSVVIGFKLEKNGDVAAQDVRDKVSHDPAAAAGRHRPADGREVQPRRRPGRDASPSPAGGRCARSPRSPRSRSRKTSKR